MNARNVLLTLAWCGFAIAIGACGDSPTRPGPVDPQPGPQQNTITLTVLDGWTRQPVAGAIVSHGIDAVTDSAGRVQVRVTSDVCQTVTVRAAGFLDRRTCSSSEVTLWPVADALERDATRMAVFYEDQMDSEWWSGVHLVRLSAELAEHDEIHETWQLAAAEIQRLTGGRISFRFVNSGQADFMVTQASAAPVCRLWLAWTIETAGFCSDWGWESRIQVLPDRLADRGTALRALLASLTISAHSAPGLLNATAPAAELSLFEQKLLHMLGIRRLDLNWPDYDIR